MANMITEFLMSVPINAESITTEAAEMLTSPQTGDIALFLTTVALVCVSVIVALAKHRRNKDDK